MEALAIAVLFLALSIANLQCENGQTAAASVSIYIIEIHTLDVLIIRIPILLGSFCFTLVLIQE